MVKTMTKYFTIADFEEEELWLREQHKKGWKFVSATIPCFYRFEQCEPEDVIYRLDFTNDESPDDYLQMLSDFGWEHVGNCVGWEYYRKPAAEADTEEDGELFSDDESRAEQVDKIMRSRMLPIFLLFFASVLPNFIRVLEGEYIGPWGMAAGALFCVLFALYVYIIVHCTVKLRNIRNRYRKD